MPTFAQAQAAAAAGNIGYFTKTTTLINAEIKALGHPTPVEIVAACGSGMGVMPIGVILDLDTIAGAYTDIDSVICRTSISWGGSVWSINQDEIEGNAFYSDSARNFIFLTSSVWGITASNAHYSGITTPLASFENTALRINVNNGASADFTGGHDSNTMKVTVIGAIIPV